MVAGLGALVAAQPAMAAYGDAANVFGKATNMSGIHAALDAGLGTWVHCQGLVERLMRCRSVCWFVIEHECMLWPQDSSLSLEMVFPSSSQQSGIHLESVNSQALSSGKTAGPQVIMECGLGMLCLCPPLTCVWIVKVWRQWWFSQLCIGDKEQDRKRSNQWLWQP